jgi:hypothetical protein
MRCQTHADVQAAVRAARTHGLPLSVRGGGHDWAGRALRDGGLVIDLSGMREVMLDSAARVATVAGGARAADVIAAAAPYGLAAATGTVGNVGMTGLTLAGGYGPLSGMHGLALDNVVGAVVVLADGRLVKTDAENEPELFWALRGGGGNFGVVVALDIRLHPINTVLGGFIVFPWSQAIDVLGGYDDIAVSAPDELTVQPGIVSAPDGSPAVLVSPTWCGDPDQGEKMVERLHGLGTPLVSQVARVPYGDLLKQFDPFVLNGQHYAARTRSVERVTPAVTAELIAAGEDRTSPLSGIFIHHFHGAAARVPLEETAFGLRRDHRMIEIVAQWDPGDGTAHRAWTDQVSSALAPFALPGGYPNMLGPDDRAQIAKAYGSNTERLQTAKRRYDPDGIFTAQPLPLA